MTTRVQSELQLSAHAKGSWDNPVGGKTMGLGLQLAQGAGAMRGTGNRLLVSKIKGTFV